MKRSTPPPLAVICLLGFGMLDVYLLGTITQSSLQPIEAPEAPTGALDGGEKKLPEVHSKQIAALGRTLAAPVFFKSRSPYIPPPPATVAPAVMVAAAPPPTVTVSGIVIDQHVKKALLITPVDNNGAWLCEGDQVMGWKVETITSAGVSLRQNSSKIDVRMYPAP